MLIHNFLEESAQKHPDKTAVFYKEGQITYAEIELLANKVANYLLKNGIGKRDRVALLYENSIDYIVNYYAILKAGAVTVALNTEQNSSSLTYLLNNSGAKAIITNVKFFRYLLPVLKDIPALDNLLIDFPYSFELDNKIPCKVTRLQDIYKNGADHHPGVNSIDIDLASIVYTSGSTGKPKGVTLTHLNVVSNTQSITNYLRLSSNDRCMVVLPFYYIYGKSLLNTHFSVGGSLVIDNRFAFPKVILDTMLKTKITGFSGVPSTYLILLNKTSVRDYKFESLRYLTQAGGAMAPSVQKEVARIFAPAELFVMYGATEASARLSYLDPKMLPQKWGSIGKAIPNVDVFIADENGNKLPPGQVGEIVARGSNIMQGYWNDPHETKRVLKNGLYFTGDLGKMDEDGFFWVAGRRKDIIKVGGERISAKEIEEMIFETNLVQEVAVIGVDDKLLGEAIKAFIVPKTDTCLTESEFKAILRKRVPSQKQPSYIVFAKNLPKNNTGKILKEKLKSHIYK